MQIDEQSESFEAASSPIAELSLRLQATSSLIGVFQRHLCWGGSQSTQSQQVVGGAHEVSVQLHALDAAKARVAGDN